MTRIKRFLGSWPFQFSAQHLSRGRGGGFTNRYRYECNTVHHQYSFITLTININTSHSILAYIRFVRFFRNSSAVAMIFERVAERENVWIILRTISYFYIYCSTVKEKKTRPYADYLLFSHVRIISQYNIRTILLFPRFNFQLKTRIIGTRRACEYIIIIAGFILCDSCEIYYHIVIQ